MSPKPTYEELKERIKALEKEAQLRQRVDDASGQRADDALYHEEDKYSTVIESSLTGIYIDQDERIAFANSRFAEIYGYSKDELIGTESRRLVHPEDRAVTDEMRSKRLSGDDAPSEYEARGLTKDGRTIWIQRRNTRMDFRGRPAILGNIVDITKQKEAEEELLRTNEELQNFFHAVSHDLKTPIISVHGFSSRLLKKFDGALGEEGRNYVLQIQESARRMELLVSDLMSLSMIGQVVSCYGEIDSLALVNKVISALQDRIKEKDAAVILAEHFPNICGDEERIYQVFENLLVNAVKYSQETRRAEIEIGCEDIGEFHRFFVKDNGIGIDPKFHRKIFEMFLRLHQKSDEEGTGLGLAIVERIVEQHGGSIWLESEKGKGTTFYFTLPKASPQTG